MKQNWSFHQENDKFYEIALKNENFFMETVKNVYVGRYIDLDIDIYMYGYMKIDSFCSRLNFHFNGKKKSYRLFVMHVRRGQRGNVLILKGI